MSNDTIKLYLEQARSRAREADVRANALAEREAALRERVLKRDDLVAARDTEELAAERQAVLQLRSTSFLKHVLATVRFNSPLLLKEAQDFIDEQARILQRDASSSVEPPVSARPADDRETREATKAQVGEHLGLTALRQKDWSRPKQERASDLIAGVSGGASKEVELRFRVHLSSSHLIVSGSVAQFVKQATFEVIMLPGAAHKKPETVTLPMQKSGRKLESALPSALVDHRRPIRVNLVLVFFPSVSQTFVHEVHSLVVSFERPEREYVFPLPFSKTVNLAGECIAVLQNPHGIERDAVVKFELLLSRLNAAIQTLVNQGLKSSANDGNRHLWTLFLIHCAFARFLSRPLSNTDLRQCIYRLCYRPVHPAFFESVPSVAVNDKTGFLVLNKGGFWSGHLFLPDFVQGLRNEAENLEALSGPDDVLVENHLVDVLQLSFNSDFWKNQLALTHPLLSGLKIESVHLVRNPDPPSPRPIPSGVPSGRCHLKILMCVDRSLSSRSNMLLAFAMARHPRLGEASPARRLPKDVFRLIAQRVPWATEDDTLYQTPCMVVRGVLPQTDRKARQPPQLACLASRPGVCICYRPEKVTVDLEPYNSPGYLKLELSIRVAFYFPQFSELPLNAMERVFSHLTLFDLGRLEKVSKSCQQWIKKTNAYQKYALARGYHSLPSVYDEEVISHATWKTRAIDFSREVFQPWHQYYAGHRAWRRDIVWERDDLTLEMCNMQ